VAVWKESGPDDFGKVTRLLMFTGCRKREIADLVWSEIDFAKRQINFPPGRVKNKNGFLLPLSDQALAILRNQEAQVDRERVFSGFSWSRYKDELDERLPEGIPHWVLHDLRRSFVTHMAENGFAQPHVIEACVNHISGAKAGVVGVYNRATYANEKRQAFDVWGQHVEDLVAGRKSKIAALRQQVG
jgi:integrase